MRILLLYHYFYPDKCVSSRIFSDLAEELCKKGDSVSVFTSNRLLRENEHLLLFEKWNNVSIYRFSHPNFNQGNNFGRLINSIILQIKWVCGFLKHKKEFDAMIVGTDPQFAYMMFPFLKLINRKIKLIHWVFDLYPEAVLVNSPLWMKMLAATMKPIAKFSYRFVDEMVDIGPCMRKKLQHYKHHAGNNTFPPWALKEPDSPLPFDPQTRHALFGNAKLGLLYSGTVGYAHDIRPFIDLARECRKKKIDAAFCLAGYGNCFKEQTSLITAEDTNIKVVGFAAEEELEKRLLSADIHLVSLRKGWEGIVVPSKFFGAISMARPVIFSGTEESSIAKWCNEYHVGMLLNEETADMLEDLLNKPETLASMKGKCFETYNCEFSKEKTCSRWQTMLETMFQNEKPVQ